MEGESTGATPGLAKGVALGLVAAAARFCLSASIRDEISALTPSNVFQKDVDPAAMAVEPAVNAEDKASRVGASCCSSLRSWMPSVSRRPKSEMRVAWPSHGCLDPSVYDVCRMPLISHLGSQISNSTGSVTALHTWYALVSRNASSHSSPNGCKGFSSPARHLSRIPPQGNSAAHRRQRSIDREPGP